MRDDFHAAKFDSEGNVRPGWSCAGWLKVHLRDVPKMPSPDLAAYLASSTTGRKENRL